MSQIARRLLVILLVGASTAVAPLGPIPAAFATYTCDATHPNSEFRWPIKSLSDADRRSVDFHAVHTTVQRMRTFDRPDLMVRPNTPRIEPEEQTTYRLRARVARAKTEPDGDVILVVTPLHHPLRTIVFEFGNPRCVTKHFKRARIGAARRAVIRNCGPLDGNFTALKGKVRVKGVGFWDRSSSEPYAAPNAFQLWPVLGIRGRCDHA